MGDSFFAPSGSPLPPEEPDVPPPIFENLGVNLGLGLAKSGTVGGFIAQIGDMLFALFAKLVGYSINILAAVFVAIIGVVGQITEDGSFGIGILIAATLNELFGVTAAPADVNGRASTPGRQAVSNNIASAFLQPLFGAVTRVEGGGILPSRDPSDKFLSVVTKMELNGWLESWVTDGLSAHLLEKYGQLKDGISRVLGLGRLSRTALRAPMKILVQDPYTAFLEQTYRTRKWDVPSLIARLNRGAITRADLSTPLGQQGYTEAQIDQLVLDHQKWLPLADVFYMNQRGTWDDQTAIDYLTFQGYTPENAGIQMQILKDKAVQKYRDEMVAVGETAYVAGNIGLDTFSTILDNSGVLDEVKQWRMQLAQLKVQVKNRHLTEGEIIKGIEDGLLNFNDLKTWAIREGMSASDEAILELETQFTENKAAALATVKAATAAAKVQAANAKLATAQQKAKAAQAESADKGLSAATAGTLVKDGIWTMAQYQAFLQTHGYGPDAVAASVALLTAQLGAAAAKTAAAGGTRKSAVAKGLNLAQIEKAVVEGIVTSDKLLKYLTGAGYSADDAQVIVDLTENALTAAQVKKDAVAAAHAKAATKSISLPDLDRAVRLGLTTPDTYTAALQKAGFDAASVTLLTGILQSQLATDKATAAKSAAASTTPTAKGITIGQLEQEVINGIRPIGDYSAALAAAGYGHEDQLELTALLQLKVDQATSTAAKKAAATKALAARGISLPAIERAVKLGVVPVSAYTQMLQSLKYTPDAVQVLTNTLIAQMAATKKAQTAATNAATTLAAKHISLPDLEKAVIAGVRPIGDYTAVLTAAGYTAGDVDTLAQLLQLKVDQRAAAEKAHADADGLATQKGISLGKEEAAIVAGDKTMADYDALLSALGYDDVDRAVLEQLLQAKIDAAAAKAGTAAPAGSGSTPA